MLASTIEGRERGRRFGADAAISQYPVAAPETEWHVHLTESTCE